jgi:hypothetical protein
MSLIAERIRTSSEGAKQAPSASAASDAASAVASQRMRAAVVSIRRCPFFITCRLLAHGD